MPPIFVSADSRPWFASDAEDYRAGVRAAVGSAKPRACYFGAANGDAPEFYEMFCAAMGRIGIVDCEHVLAEQPAPLSHADLVLLSGGDVAGGWRALVESGADGILRQRHEAGAVLVGISAGAIHLGLGMAFEGRIVPMLGLVPSLVDAHNEEDDWRRLRAAVRLAGPPTRGLGIPFGSAAVYRQGRVERCVGPLAEWSWKGADLVEPAP